MSTARLCDCCSGFKGGLGLPPIEPTHCYGEGDTPGQEGLIGSGNYCPCECRSWPHQPAALWDVAAKAHPDNAEARRDHYLALMREHGHIVKREAGDDRPLFPCGYEPRRD